MRAVKVTREAIALRGRMQIVQMRGDLGRAETDVVIGELIVDAANNRLAIAGKDGGAGSGGVGGVPGEAPDGLRRIRWVEDPRRVFLGRHLIEDRRATAADAAELTEALVRGPACFTGG